MYDITSMESFQTLLKWNQTIEEVCLYAKSGSQERESWHNKPFGSKQLIIVSVTPLGHINLISCFLDPPTVFLEISKKKKKKKK